MYCLPREIISEILLYFGGYQDELHKSFKVGPRDIYMHSLIVQKYDNEWDNIISKENENTTMKNIVDFYDYLFEKYGFTEAEHLIVLRRMQQINLFFKGQFGKISGKHDNYTRSKSTNYILYYKTYELENILNKILGYHIIYRR